MSEAKPKVIRTIFRRASLYSSLGKTPDAIADLKRYLELESDPELCEQAEKLLQSLGG